MSTVPDPPWKTYSRAIVYPNRGEALWEPTQIKLADVGYIREGRFHLLFSAGLPLGTRKLGIDVPFTFEPLDFGLVVRSQPRPPGYLRTSTVEEIGVDMGASSFVPRFVEPGARLILELNQGEGAALVTNSPIHGEDIERFRAAKVYVGVHYDSWVDFALARGHGDDNLQPILITGVDRVREFGMVAYSHNPVRMECEFTAAVPGFAPTSISLRGMEHTEGLVGTNCGSQSMAMETALHQGLGTISNEHDQCVFVRYITERRRNLIPKVIRAGAGPHNAGDRDREDGDPDSRANARGGSGGGSDLLFRGLTSYDMEDLHFIERSMFRGTNAETIQLHGEAISRFRRVLHQQYGDTPNPITSGLEHSDVLTEPFPEFSPYPISTINSE